MQMVSLHKDPKGENIFKNSNIMNQSLPIKKDYSDSNDTEVSGLRRQIKEMEDALKKKDVR